ncbi:MAG: ATP-binding protein [Thaumarchaeota archaeon]|nr:ATP-binding protein [Nitrososphaerota archaeon]
MSLEPRSFVLGYLAAAVELLESRVWFRMGNELNRLGGYIEFDQHARLISAALPSKLDQSVILATFDGLIKQGAVEIEYRSNKSTYYGQELVVGSRCILEASQAKPVVAKAVEKWLQDLFSNPRFAALYSLAVKDTYPDNLLQTVAPEEFTRLRSSGLIGRWYVGEASGTARRKVLAFRSGTPLAKIVDQAVTGDAAVKAAGEMKEKVSQLPTNQKRLLSVISRFGHLTVSKGIGQQYSSQPGSNQQALAALFSDIEVTKDSILAIAGWDTGLTRQEIDEAYEQLLQKGYLVKVRHIVYGGIYRDDVVPILKEPDAEPSTVDVKPYIDYWLKEDITQIQLLDEVLSRQKPNRLSVKESEVASFSRLTENTPPKEVPGIYIYTSEGVTINPSVKSKLREEIDKVKLEMAKTQYSKLPSLKRRYEENPLFAVQEEPSKQRVRIYAPKASYLIMTEAWLNSKQVEEVRTLSSQVDHALLFIVHQKQIWLKEILKPQPAIPNLGIAYVSQQNILLDSTDKNAFENIINDIRADHKAPVEQKTQISSEKTVTTENITPEVTPTPIPPTTPEQPSTSTPTPAPALVAAPKPVSRPPNITSTSSAGKMILGQLVEIEDLQYVVADSSLDRGQKRDSLQPVGDFFLPIEVMATHTAIFGANQGGKTTTTKRLIAELSRLKIPVLIIDWHSEYTDLTRRLGGSILVPPTALVKPQDDEIPLTWNILDPRFYAMQLNEEVLEDYIGLVVNMLSMKQIMNLTEPMKSAMTNALRNAYSLTDISQGKFPTFDDIRKALEGLPLQTGTLDALIRRLNIMTAGTLGSIFCDQTSFNPSVLFNKNVCIKMNHLTEDFDYAVGLLTFFILRQAASYFKTLGEAPHDHPLRHVVVIDEAPAVLRSYSDVQKLLGRMLEELRKFGEGVIVVARNTDIPKIVLRETNQKIVHKLQLPQDIDGAAEMLGIKPQKDIIADLPPGVCFLKSAGDKPKLIRISKP